MFLFLKFFFKLPLSTSLSFVLLETKDSSARLAQDGLVLALCAVVSLEARTSSRVVVAQATARAVTARLVTLTLEYIGARRALDERAVGAASAKIAHASDVLLGVPGLRVQAASLIGELLLGEAHPGLGAVVRAYSSLAGDSLVILEASTRASLCIARSLIGALRDGVRIVSGDDISHPGLILRASSLRAVGLRPSGLAVNSRIALTLIIGTALAVTTASIGAVRRHSREEHH